MNTEAQERFKNFLKGNKNHRITSERFEVMDAALEYEGHFVADDLYIKMKNSNSSVSRATVYKTLDLLAECELIIKRNFGDNLNRFENNFRRSSHDHFVCRNCGKVAEFNDPQLRAIADNIANELGFDISGYSFNIFGKCKDQSECRPSNE